ncbi:MAG: hypothetical protein GEV10_09710 [Streptosporangiales bacterium]|nr:hypothetical protein [Streptosporangiales bacterium]
MNNGYLDNDGRFPDDTAVLVKYPRPSDSADRDTWPWMTGVILGQVGPDEWDVLVEDHRVTQTDIDGDIVYPMCWRDASELRRIDRGAAS